MKEAKLMDSLPDEIWIKIFEIGLQNSKLSCSDLCSLSISCKHFQKLSNADLLWSILLTLVFPRLDHNHDVSSSSSIHSKKTLYKYRYEKDTRRKLASIRRKIVKNESLLDALAVMVKQLGRRTAVVNARTEVLSGELLDMISYSPVLHHKTIERLHDRAMVTNESMKELSHKLIEMIGQRAPDITLGEEAAVVATPTSVPSSTCSNSKSVEEFLVTLETKIDELVSLQGCFLSTQLKLWLKLNILLRRKQENSKQLEVLTSRLETLGTVGYFPSEIVNDEDDDTEEDEEDEDEEDDDDTEEDEEDDDDVGYDSDDGE